MKQKLLTIMALLILSLTPILAFAGTGYAATDNCGSDNSAKQKINEGIGQTGNNCEDTGVTNTIQGIIKIISYIAGVVAIIMIIVSGFRFITSGGDSGKVASARNSLIYALIGIVVVVLAQVMVNFVFTQATKDPTPPATTKKTTP